MGVLCDFELSSLIKLYNTRVFVETGTGLGTGLQHAMLFPFSKIISIEIIADHAQEMARRFSFDSRVDIRVGNSGDVLREILPQIDVPVLFWLDAHFPGADLHRAAFDAESDENLRLPLENELVAISETRGSYSDVLLIDDLRIYERDFPGNSLRACGLEHLGKYNGLLCLDSLFGSSHRIQRIYVDTGYVELTPLSPAY
jgi:hypothetical protein